MQYAKVQSVSKEVAVKGTELSTKVLDTMKRISAIVGATLGPGGSQVLLERQEIGMPPALTKDGVTVFRSLGFKDPIAHNIMEAARDASVRTASEAGDGTTTATVLSEAIVRLMDEYVKANPKVSPQKIVRKLQKTFTDFIEPEIKRLSMSADLTSDRGRSLLHSVAKVSANGDVDLADAVLKCFDMVGDDGNVTISEVSGGSGYEVEKVKGFPIKMGYEDSCGKFYPKFLNTNNQRTILEKPLFVIYHGKVTDIGVVVNAMEKIGSAWNESMMPEYEGIPTRHNVVLLATGFSESVLGQLAHNFAATSTINVFPLLAPQSPFPQGQLDFLLDVASVTDGVVFDSNSIPLERAELQDFGTSDSFECGRYFSSIMGYANENALFERVDQLKAQLTQFEGAILEQGHLNERIAKLAGGIAKLKIRGSSSGEMREKRDRADDAVCAVRGTIKHGCLPGGGWTLAFLANSFVDSTDSIDTNILADSLMVPVELLLTNTGLDEEEVSDIFGGYGQDHINYIKPQLAQVWDALEGKWVNAVTGGILDSTPAVLEAIRNSISIASLLGTLGGCVVYNRDSELERTEARETNQFLRSAGEEDPSNMRA